MSFVNGTGEWASLSGKASIVTDRETVRKYYSPQLKAWVGDLGDGTHDGSAEDPRIAVIRIETATAQYAVSLSNSISRGVEVSVAGALYSKILIRLQIVKGAVTGDAAQVNKLRQISEEEISQWRSKTKL